MSYEAGLEKAAGMLEDWAAADEATSELETADCLRRAAECIRALKTPEAKVACVCDGCERQVPTTWRTPMCHDCAAADCQHGDDDDASRPQSPIDRKGSGG